MKIIEAKAIERNVYLNSQSNTLVSGSYVTMRVPGSPNKLAMFEFNTQASDSIKDLDDDGYGWIGRLMQPLIFIAFIGGACYVSFNNIK